VAKTKKKHTVVVRKEFCKGCDLCIEFCKENVLKSSEELNKMGYNYAEPVNMEKCNGCMICVLVCPDLVLEVYYE
jgi:2-oxoglutarate ferredoxin oxidoreductase subunit delta